MNELLNSLMNHFTGLDKYEEMSSDMTKKEKYRQLEAECGLKIGDIVKILRKVGIIPGPRQ